MFIRAFCLLCLVIIHSSAFPAPQDDESSTEDVFATDDPESVTNETIAESSVDKLDKETEEINVQVVPIEPSATQELSIDATLSQIGDSDSEDSSSELDTSGEGTEQSTSADEKPNTDEIEKADEDETVKLGSENDKSNPDEILTFGDEPKSNSTEKPEDDKKPNDPSMFDLGRGDIPSLVISNIDVLGYQLRVDVELSNYGNLVCQMLVGKDKEIVDKECLVSRGHQEFVNANQKIINGEKYLCQEIINPLEGLLHQLCITGDGYIFNPVLLQDNLIYYKITK